MVGDRLYFFSAESGVPGKRALMYEYLSENMVTVISRARRELRRSSGR